MSRVAVVEIIKRGPMGPPGDMESSEWLEWQSTVNSKADAATVTSQLAGKVGTTGSESIGGTKTFSSSPKVPTPSEDDDAARKDYVDTNVGRAVVSASAPVSPNPGKLWFDTSAPEAVAISRVITISESPPQHPVVHDLWIELT